MSGHARPRQALRGPVPTPQNGRVDRDSIEPGDLVEIAVTEQNDRSHTRLVSVGPIKRVRRHARGEHPGPGSEVARLSRRRLDHLHKRARVLAAVRGFFARRDFLEVETPLLVPAPGLEVQLSPVPAGGSPALRSDHQPRGPQHAEPGGWLITSPEFQMKRLLAAGLDRIFTICKCFRAGESGHHHAVEFTMLEWYRGFSDLESIVFDIQELIAEAAIKIVGTTRLPATSARPSVDVAPPWIRLTVAEAMDQFGHLTVRGDEAADILAERALSAGIDLRGATEWDEIFYAAFVERVEPALAQMDRPVTLVDWPVRLAALARRKPGNDRVVERFEAYIAGIELANAFGELTSAREQRARFDDELRVRTARGLPVFPLDERFLAALEEGLPPCAGIALGIDRLVMLLCGADHIREVLAFGPGEL